MNAKNEKKRILIVDDEESLRRALAEMLRHEGFEVMEAGDGREALAEISKELPDLILLDIIMPHMDGRAVLKKIREKQEFKDVKIIFLTNLSDVNNIADMVEMDTPDYLVKSDWSIADIVKKIREKIM